MNCAVFDDDFAARLLNNALLMSDDDDSVVWIDLMHLLEEPCELVETPKVDASLRLVEDSKTSVTGDNGGDFDAFELAAGEGIVDLAVEIAFVEANGFNEGMVIWFALFEEGLVAGSGDLK